jgi:hypothetical protein
MEQKFKASLEVDITDFQKSLTEAEKLLESLKKAQERVNNGLKGAVTSFNQAEAELSKLNQQFRNGAISQTEYNKRQDELAQKVALARQNVATYQREQQRLTQNIQRQNAVIVQSQNALKNASTQVNVIANSTVKLNGQISSLRNNIITTIAPTNALGGAFGRASVTFTSIARQAGGASGAFKLIASSFLGPAGLIFAITTGIGLLASFIDLEKIGASIAGLFASDTEKAKRALDDYNKALENNINNLGKIDSARLEGEKNAQKELVTVENLTRIINDLSLSDDKRLKAVEELRKLYPTILKNYTNEAILAGNAKDQIDLLTKSIIQKATAEAFANKIVEERVKQLDISKNEIELNKQRNKLRQEELRLEADLAKEKQKSSLKTTGASGIDTNVTSIERKLDNVRAKIREIESAELLGIDQLKSTKENISLIEDELTKASTEIIGIFDKTGKESGEALTNGIKEKYDPSKLILDTEILTTKFGEDLEKGINANLEKLAQGLLAKDRLELKLKVDFIPETDGGEAEVQRNIFRKAQEYAEKAAKDLDQVLTQTFANTISNLYNKLGNDLTQVLGISNKAVASFVQSIVSSTPAIIGALVAQSKAKVATSAVNVSASKAEATAGAISAGVAGASAFGPFAPFVLPALIGGALLAVTSAFRGVKGAGGASSAVSSATGSVGSSIAGIGSNANLFDGLNLVSQIRGTDLQLVLKRVENNQSS